MCDYRTDWRKQEESRFIVTNKKRCVTSASSNFMKSKDEIQQVEQRMQKNLSVQKYVNNLKPSYSYINVQEVPINSVCVELYPNSNIPPSPPPPRIGAARPDAVIYCGHPSLPLIHHRPVARQQLFALEPDRVAVSQRRRQVKSITNKSLSCRLINQRRGR